MPKLLSIQVAFPQTLPGEDAAGPWVRPWTTGFFKRPVSHPVWLGRTNLAGDGQADLDNHGGPDKAVNVYPSEHYPFWRDRLRLPELSHGAFGENFTLLGLVEGDVCIGDVYRLGEALMQVSQPRQPCWKLARRWRIKDLASQVQQLGYTGWYFRVITEGEVAAGMSLSLVDRPHADWTVAAANDIMHHRRHDLQAAARLAAYPFLSASWRDHLSRRAAGLSQPE